MTLYEVDVSSNNSVAAATTEGAGVTIVKATQGNWYVNPSCNAQYAAAKAKGNLLGLYHYAEGGDPVAEADYFINNIKNYVGEAVLALDWESGSNKAWGNKDWALKFVNRVHDTTGVYPLVYVQASAISQVASTAPYSGLWVAAYPYKPGTNSMWDEFTDQAKLNYSIAPWEAYTIWQYTSSNGKLDRGIVNVDANGWKKLANPSAKPSTTPAAVKPAPQPAQPAANWVADNETYTLKTAVNLRTGASTGASVIATLPAGTTVKTDQAIIQGGYRWVRQPRVGGYGYLATGPANNTLEFVSMGTTSRAIAKGDTVRVTKAVDTSGNKLMVSGTYTVTQLDGSRAVISKGGVVVAAINVGNLALA